MKLKNIDIIFLLFLLSFLPYTYFITVHETEISNYGTTLSSFIGELRKRNELFIQCFVITSFFFLAYIFMKHREITLFSAILIVSTFGLLYAPEQFQLWTHTVFAVSSLFVILIFMGFYSVLMHSCILGILFFINILLFAYICIFFRTKNIVYMEVMYILYFLLFLGVMHNAKIPSMPQMPKLSFSIL